MRKPYTFKSFFDQIKKPGVQLRHNDTYLTNGHFLVKKSTLKKNHISILLKIRINHKKTYQK